MCLAPDPLTLLEPVIDRGNRGGFPRPWKQGRLVPEYALEGGESRSGLTEGVLCVLGPGEELAQAVLVVMAEGQKSK